MPNKVPHLSVEANRRLLEVYCGEYIPIDSNPEKEPPQQQQQPVQSKPSPKSSRKKNTFPKIAENESMMKEMTKPAMSVNNRRLPVHQRGS